LTLRKFNSIHEYLRFKFRERTWESRLCFHPEAPKLSCYFLSSLHMLKARFFIVSLATTSWLVWASLVFRIIKPAHLD
jgi:hypothetical protein